MKALASYQLPKPNKITPKDLREMLMIAYKLGRRQALLGEILIFADGKIVFQEEKGKT